jgi:hypothetical protein
MKYKNEKSNSSLKMDLRNEKSASRTGYGWLFWMGKVWENL